MPAELNPDVTATQAGGGSVDRERAGHALLHTDPALGAPIELDQRGLSVLVLEDVFRADLFAHAGALTQLVVDAYGHGTLLRLADGLHGI